MAKPLIIGICVGSKLHQSPSNNWCSSGICCYPCSRL